MNQEQDVRLRFESPVRIVSRTGKTAEICSPSEAFDFLMHCPIQDGPIFESALEACFVATYDAAALGDARQGLKAFAGAHGFLA